MATAAAGFRRASFVATLVPVLAKLSAAPVLSHRGNSEDVALMVFCAYCASAELLLLRLLVFMKEGFIVSILSFAGCTDSAHRPDTCKDAATRVLAEVQIGAAVTLSLFFSCELPIVIRNSARSSRNWPTQRRHHRAGIRCRAAWPDASPSRSRDRPAMDASDSAPSFLFSLPGKSFPKSCAGPG